MLTLIGLLPMVKGSRSRSSTRAQSPYCSRREMRPFSSRRSSKMTAINTEEEMIH